MSKRERCEAAKRELKQYRAMLLMKKHIESGKNCGISTDEICKLGKKIDLLCSAINSVNIKHGQSILSKRYIRNKSFESIATWEGLEKKEVFEIARKSYLQVYDFLKKSGYPF